MKLLSNKFNCEIMSVGTLDNYEFNIEEFNQNLIKLTKLTKLTNSNELAISNDLAISNESTNLNYIQLICSQKINVFNKKLDIDEIEHSKSNVFIKIYANKSYISTEAQNQLTNLKKMDGIKYLIGMPDLHKGKIPVGSVCISDVNTIYPELVGSDIGCGMSLIKTSIKINKYSLKQLEKLAEKIDIGKFIFLNDLEKQNHIDKFYSNTINLGNFVSGPIDLSYWNKFDNLKNYQIIEHLKDLSLKYVDSIGTIGLGNHFVELLQFDKSISNEFISKYNIDESLYYILVHYGSRGLGEEILQLYQSGQIDIDQYKLSHNYAVEWSKHNQWSIAVQFGEYLGTSLEYLLDLTHNWIESVYINNYYYNIHRKGAAPIVSNSPVVILGSRGTRTWLVEPNHSNHNLETGYSVSHGAGRKISRLKAFEGIKNKSIIDKNICCQGDTDINNIVICQNVNLLYEEAPFAYKDIKSVIDDLEYFKLAHPICSFTPVITFKCKK